MELSKHSPWGDIEHRVEEVGLKMHKEEARAERDARNAAAKREFAEDVFKGLDDNPGTVQKVIAGELEENAIVDEIEENADDEKWRAPI